MRESLAEKGDALHPKVCRAERFRKKPVTSFELLDQALPVWDGFLLLATKSTQRYISHATDSKMLPLRLKNYQWLPIVYRIEFKFLSLAPRSVYKMASIYFSTFISNCYLIRNSSSVKLVHNLSPEYSELIEKSLLFFFKK